MVLASGGFTGLDWVVLAAYFVGITLFGLWMARKIKSSSGYFLGDRKLPWWVMVGQAFGTGTHAENPVAQAGAVWEKGFATIWYQWKNMLITPFYWLMAPWYRRCQRTTIGEMMEDRYGRGMAFLYTVFALCYFVFNQGTMMKGAGKAISMATGGELLSANDVVVAMVGAFVLYSFFGGLIASAYTDFVQGFLIIVMSFVLIPAGLWAVGGFHGMRQTLHNESFFDLYNQSSGVDAFTIVMLTLNGFIGITAQPHILSMNATGKTERAGRLGQTYGSFVKRFCTIGWALTGLIVAAMVVRQGTTLDDKEKAFGYACLHLLGPGLTGLMVACILAANMSTCSNFMVNSGALFSKNFYLAYLRPTASDRELLLAGRLSGLGLTGLGAVFALGVGQVLDAFMFNETIPAFVGIAVMGGILWKGANRYGAFTAVMISLMVYYALSYLLTCSWQGQQPQAMTQAFDFFHQAWQHGQTQEFLAGGKLKLVYQWLPGPFGLAILAGLIPFILLSLLTRREDPARIARFFDLMSRTSDADDSGAGRTKPLAGERGQDLLLLDLPGWLTRERWQGFFRRYREDLVGFALGWATVGVLVLIAWGVMQIGK